MCDTCGCASADPHGETLVLPVEGMTCPACSKKLVEVIGKLDGVHHVEADHEKGTLSFALSENGDLAKVREGVLDAGFDL